MTLTELDCWMFDKIKLFGTFKRLNVFAEVMENGVKKQVKKIMIHIFTGK